MDRMKLNYMDESWVFISLFSLTPKERSTEPRLFDRGEDNSVQYNVKRLFGRMEDCMKVALRYERLTDAFLRLVRFVCGMTLRTALT